MRGIRGAINVARNTRAEILSKTEMLLEALLRENRIRQEQVTAAFFSLTSDLNAEFPAIAARQMGWIHVPLMCCSELSVPGAMKKVVRIMLLVETGTPPEKIRHQYLGNTLRLRPDLSGKARRK
jgi:chorismate mutase